MTLLNVRNMHVGEWYSLEAHDLSKNPVTLRFQIVGKSTSGVVSARVRYEDGVEESLNGLVLGFAKKIHEPLFHFVKRILESVLLFNLIFPKKHYTLEFKRVAALGEETQKVEGFFHFSWVAIRTFRKYAMEPGSYSIFCNGSPIALFAIRRSKQ